jgi:predicted XRE-type DNA-binding protein
MDAVKSLGNYTRKLLNDDWDFLITVDGLERVGKSTLALLIAFEHMKLKTNEEKIKFIKNNIVYSGIGIREKAYELPRFSVIINDEAGLDAFNRDALKKFNKDLIKTLMVCGERNQLFILNFPNFWWLDPYIRDHRCQLWIHCYHKRRNRGYSRWMYPTRSMWKGMPFWNLEFEYRYGKLDGEVFEAYKKKKSEEAKRRMIGKEDKSTNLKRDIAKKMMASGKFKQKDVAKYLGVTPQRISQYERKQ